MSIKVYALGFMGLFHSKEEAEKIIDEFTARSTEAYYELTESNLVDSEEVTTTSIELLLTKAKKIVEILEECKKEESIEQMNKILGDMK